MTYKCQYSRIRKRSTEAALVLGGEKVSRLSVHPHEMRIGACEVLMGGIGGVATPAEHRNKGYASVVMADSIKWMRDNGYDMSVLFGIPDFYHRWGFISTLLNPRVTVPVRHAEMARRSCGVRDYCDSDLGDYIRVYNRENAARTGSIVRKKPTWVPLRKGLVWGRKPQAYALMLKGKLAGVAAYSLENDKVACVELCASDPAVYPGVLHHAAQLAIERRVENIDFHVPLDHAFVAACLEEGCQLHAGAPRCSGGMARLINQAQCLTKVAPELTRRLKRSALCSWSGVIDIVTNLETTRLVVKRGEVKVAPSKGRADLTLKTPQERLTQLLFGYQDIAFLLASTKTTLTGDRQGVIATLFAPGCAHMWIPDHF